MAGLRDDRGRFLPKAKPTQTITEFARRMKIRGDHIPIGTSNLIRKMALSIDQQIVKRTPVDTGRARSNWIVNVGSAAAETVEPFLPDGNAGATRGALAQAQQAIASAPAFTKEIHITNNLSYIGELNNGSSAQAPKNFVELGIRDGSRIVLGGKVKITEK